ncbi:MAG: two pore domain potassium channel family protein [Candidatus Aminicenantes bacterium]|nr:two pore domain potassium channel family protein [Candidatus Aminicenantes bacterium]
MKIFRERDEMVITRVQKYPKFMKYRYTYLMISIVALFVLAPLFEQRIPLIMPLLFLGLMIAVLGTLDLRPSILRIMIVFALIGFCNSMIARVFQLSPQNAHNFYVVGLSIESLFLFTAITILIRKIFSEKNITTDTIKGGISVYFLMGFLWTYLYSLLLILDPQALALAKPTFEFSILTYFSFTTLTTLGYGDITPVSWLARNLTILESTIGQIYMTVLIARLVGLHIAGKQLDRRTPVEDK